MPLPVRFVTIVSAIGSEKPVGQSYRVKRIEGRRVGAMVISIMEMDSGVRTSS
jgi:hypothetical protein